MDSFKDGKSRILFVIKSTLLGVITGTLFLLIVFLLGSVNFWQTLVINTFLFVLSVIILRYFGKYINLIVMRIDRIIERSPKAKGFVLKYM